MRAVAVPLFVLLCAALACGQETIAPPPPTTGGSAASGSGSSGSGGSAASASGPSGGLWNVPGSDVEVVVPALIHESLIMRITGSNYSTDTVNATYLNVSQALQLPFRGEPLATNDSIAIGLVVMSGNVSAAALSEAELVRASVLPARDMEAMLSEANANVLMTNLWANLDHFGVHYELPWTTAAFQLLVPDAYEACADCPLSVSASFTQAPAAFFNHSAAYVFENLVASMDGAGANGSVPLVQLRFNGTIVLTQAMANNFSHLGISLDVPSLVVEVAHSVIGSAADGVIMWLVQSLITHVLVAELNQQWNSVGVFIPMFGNAHVVALEFNVSNAAVHVGADLDVHAAAEPSA